MQILCFTLKTLIDQTLKKLCWETLWNWFGHEIRTFLFTIFFISLKPLCVIFLWSLLYSLGHSALHWPLTQVHLQQLLWHVQRAFLLYPLLLPSVQQTHLQLVSLINHFTLLEKFDNSATRLHLFVRTTCWSYLFHMWVQVLQASFAMSASKWHWDTGK